MRRYVSIFAVIGLAMLAAQTSATAAQTAGHAYPCTQAFAKRVAYGSGFVDRANQVRPSYTNPAYWGTSNPICADFDGDGNDEMVFNLGAMGGFDPWAFFNLPSTVPEESTYVFPTLSQGLYPNHFLELVDRGQFLPLIRDKRALYRRRDAHCCPTAGTQIRYVGFKRSEGAYAVLGTYVNRPDTRLRRSRLSAGAARYDVAVAMRRRFGTVWSERAGGQIRCGRRSSFSVRRCDVAWGIGDAGYFGRVRVASFERARSVIARVRYRITRLDEYCAFVLHRPQRKCVRHYRGHTRVR